MHKHLFRDAAVLLREALKNAERAKIEDSVIEILSELSQVEFFAGDASSARKHALQALKFCTKKTKPRLETTALAVYAISASSKTEALNAARKADQTNARDASRIFLNLFWFAPDRMQATIVNADDLAWQLAPGLESGARLTLIYSRLSHQNQAPAGSLSNARWYMVHAKDGFLLPEERPICYECAGAIFLHSNAGAETRKAYSMAREARVKLTQNEISSVGNHYAALARDMAALGDARGALHVAESSLQDLPSDQCEGRGALEKVIADVYGSLKEYKRALVHLNQAIKAFSQTKNPLLLSSIQARKSLVLLAKNSKL